MTVIITIETDGDAFEDDLLGSLRSAARNGACIARSIIDHIRNESESDATFYITSMEHSARIYDVNGHLCGTVTVD